MHAVLGLLERVDTSETIFVSSSFANLPAVSKYSLCFELQHTAFTIAN
jgi:hypothetical protein